MFGRTLKCVDGLPVEILDPGLLNTDSGPDFFNSKIRLDGTEWVGNIEIHTKASDWFRHGHDSDPAYDSIILHAVGVSDKRVHRSDGTPVPQVEITLPPGFFDTYARLEEGAESLRCAEKLADMPSIAVTDWLETLSVERVQKRAARVTEILEETGGDWEQTCFITLARALGFGLNGDPFEMLARSIPLKFLHRHSDSPLQLQAILFGQAAMLDSSLHIFDEFYQALCREYFFLARKYGLRPMRPGLWKYSRTRPQNFPHRRIAMLAEACNGGFALFSKIIHALGDLDAIRALFAWELQGYWHTHSSFDLEAKTSADNLSPASTGLIVLNAVVPLAYAYASHNGDPDIAERAMNLLDQLPAEKNSVMKDWALAGLYAKDARRSQALLHLRREYCETRKCLYCRFGHRALKNAAVPAP